MSGQVPSEVSDSQSVVSRMQPLINSVVCTVVGAIEGVVHRRRGPFSLRMIDGLVDEADATVAQAEVCSSFVQAAEALSLLIDCRRPAGIQPPIPVPRQLEGAARGPRQV